MERADKTQLTFEQLALSRMLEILPRGLRQRRERPVLDAGGEQGVMLAAGLSVSAFDLMKVGNAQRVLAPSGLSSKLMGSATGGGGTTSGGLSGGPGGPALSTAR